MYTIKRWLFRASILTVYFSGSLVITHPLQAASTEAPTHISVDRTAGGDRIVAAGDLAELKRRGSATVSINGAAYPVAEGRVFELDGASSWIGRSLDRNVVLVVTETPVGHEISVLEGGREYRQSVAGQREPGLSAVSLDPEVIERNHRLAVRVAVHQATRARVSSTDGRIETLKGRNIGRVARGQLQLSSTFLDTIELKEVPTFQPESQPGAAYRNRITQNFQQTIHGIPLRVYVRAEFDQESGEIIEIDGPIYPEAEAPAPAKGDTGVREAVSLLRDFAAKELRENRTDEIYVSPLRREYVYNAGRLELGWSGIVRTAGKQYTVFLNAKTNAVLYNHGTRRNRTCSANNTTATDCDDGRATLVIDSNGVCVYGTEPSTCTAHQTVLGHVNDAIADYSTQNPGGRVVPTDIEILIDADLPVGDAGRQDYNADGTPYIRVGPEGTVTEETAAHEAAHVWIGAKVPSIRPDPHEDPGETALAEGTAYVMDSLYRDDLGNLDWPGAHVDDYDPAQDEFINSTPLQRAIYELVTDSINFPQSEVYKVVTRAIARMGNTNSCVGADCLDIVRESMRDVLEDMADDNEIPGSVKTARKNEVNRAFGKVGLGPDSSPPSPPPVPTPPPFVLITQTHTCRVLGNVQYTEWRVSWFTQPSATRYDVYRSPNTFELAVTDNDYFAYVPAGVSFSTFVRACNNVGCSLPSNTLTHSFLSQCGL